MSRHAYLPRDLPPGLESLGEMSLDLRWTWSHVGDALWRMVDLETWDAIRNPWVMMQTLPRSKFDQLAADSTFRRELDALIEERSEYLEAKSWFTETHTGSGLRSIAYFSMEFGLSEALPLYAGGLGVLAGDYLKTASDLGVPVVGVGLLYHEGYFRQTVDASGWQQATYPYNEPMTLPIQPASAPEGGWLRVHLEFPGRRVMLRVWRANVGRVSLYLLDSNDPLNLPADRAITSKLYGGGREMRLIQEIVLGIGGWRVLEALRIEPQVCHLNEGHAAFVVLERTRSFMKTTGCGFWEAFWTTRAGNVFTTHTPVAAGFDVFSPELIARYVPYFRPYVRDVGVSLDDLLALGRKAGNDAGEPFNMAYLAMRGCSRANGVSLLHGSVSRRMFTALYPRWPEAEVPVSHVTNGVHTPSWDSSWADGLWTSACGRDRWRWTTEMMEEAIESLGDEAIWSFCTKQRADFVAFVRHRLVRQLKQRSASPELVARAGQVLDPNVLIVGFARRFAQYKRPGMLLEDPSRLKRMLTDPDRPIQIVVAGKAHPDDDEAKHFVREWVRFANQPEVRHRVVYLEDYDIGLAQAFVGGVDVWVNTPRRPWEACGTSGMKVLVNGGLNLSELDGWWAEAYSPEVGWALGDGSEHEDGTGDATEANALYELLENEVTRLFYKRDSHGVPREWVTRIRRSMSLLAPRFSSNRMVREYVEAYYVPAAAAYGRRSSDGARIGTELRRWEERIVRGWNRLHFGDLEVARLEGYWEFTVGVYLCDIPPADVLVELYADGNGKLQPVRQPMTVGGDIPGSVRGYRYQARVETDRPADHFTPRIVPFHPDASVPAEMSSILWQR